MQLQVREVSLCSMTRRLVMHQSHFEHVETVGHSLSILFIVHHNCADGQPVRAGPCVAGEAEPALEFLCLCLRSAHD